MHLPVRREDDVMLREVLHLLAKEKWKIIGCMLVFLALSVLYILFAPAEYKAQAIVQVDKRNTQVPGVATAAADPGVPGTSGVTEVQLLTSRSVVGVAVDKLNLVEKLIQKPSGDTPEAKANDRLLAIDMLRRDLSAAEQGRDSGVILMEYIADDPVLARKVLEEVTGAYIAQNMERNSAEAERSMRFVQAQLPKVRAELEQAQAALSDYQSKNQAVDVPQQTASLLAQSNALDANLQQLRIQQADLARRYTPRHPSYQSVMRQIGDLASEERSIRQRLSALPDIQRGLLQLQGQVDVTSQTYSNLLDQAQKFDIARASAVGSARVIDPPNVNPRPWWPKPILVLAFGALLGLLVAVMWLVVRRIVLAG